MTFVSIPELGAAAGSKDYRMPAPKGIRFATSGLPNMNTPLASMERPDFTKIENRAPSVAHMFLNRVAATPHAEAFRYPQDHSWESVTWQQVGERVCNIAGGLISLGIAPEDRVALASSTRYEWVLVDFAVMCAGAATTTVYPTTKASDVAYIVANSGSRVVVAAPAHITAKSTSTHS